MVGELGVQLFSFGADPFVSSLWSHKTVAAVLLLVELDMSHPRSSAFIPRHALVARRVIHVLLSVELVLAVSGQPEIFDSVIQGVAVYVIYLSVSRIFAIEDQPSKPVRSV